jgi:anti-sigma regulatory factor (Ser/Thr protein kinase)
VIATSRLAGHRKWASLSFVSTLYLHPVLEILLSEVPRQWQAELRLGLQEALVNASKHGNGLDPRKQVLVRYSTLAPRLSWIIADQGSGFNHPCGCGDCFDQGQFHMGEGGRGLYILYQVFDQVAWHQGGREVHLHKTITQFPRVPLVS